jgi:pyruvate carboxylase
MALMMVASELTAEDVLDPSRDIAFPESVVSFFRGDLGQPPNGFPQALQNKVLKGEAPITVRPGALLAEADLEAERAKAAEALGGEAASTDLASYLMYPKVFTEFAKAQELYGPTEVLPTPAYFYGLAPGSEILVELEPGKTLVVQCLAVGETDDEGQVRVFFELNGQPRTVRVPDRAHGAAAGARRPKAEEGNDAHVAAPMPGVVAMLAVKPGQKVSAGDVLLSIEAMKMETVIHAERDGTIAEITVAHGDAVDAKDLLLAYEAG